MSKRAFAIFWPRWPYIRRLPQCGGKVGAVGYCLGSRLAYLMSTRSDIDCAVGYYGVGIETMLDEVYDIRTPLMLHFAENDKLVTRTARAKTLATLAKNPSIRLCLSRRRTWFCPEGILSAGDAQQAASQRPHRGLFTRSAFGLEQILP